MNQLLNLSKRTAGLALLVVGGFAAIIGIAIVGFGFSGLVIGMHGGPISALLMVLLGTGPLGMGYILGRKGLRLVRLMENGRAASSH